MNNNIADTGKGKALLERFWNILTYNGIPFNGSDEAKGGGNNYILEQCKKCVEVVEEYRSMQGSKPTKEERKVADRLGEIAATLVVNYGENGRLHKGLIKASEDPFVALQTVLNWYEKQMRSDSSNAADNQRSSEQQKIEPLYKWVDVRANMPEDDSREDYPRKHILKCRADGLRGERHYYVKEYDAIKGLIEAYDDVEILFAAEKSDTRDDDSSTEVDNPKGKQGSEWISVEEITRRKQMIQSEPDGVVRETMIDNLDLLPAAPNSEYPKERAEIRCKCSESEKHGQTSVMCCNHCGLPDEEFWVKEEAHNTTDLKKLVQKIYESTTDSKVREMIDNA